MTILNILVKYTVFFDKMLFEVMAELRIMMGRKLSLQCFITVVAKRDLFRGSMYLQWNLKFHRQPIRAQPDITSGPEVRQIVKIRTFRKPDIFIPGRQTFENRKKKSKNQKIKFQKKKSNFFFKNFFKTFFMIIYFVKCLKI